MSTKSKWLGGTPIIYKGYEHLLPMASVVFFEDFMGAFLKKYKANENTTAKWNSVETNLNTAIALVANEVNGVAAIILDSDDNAEVGCLHHGDQLGFSMKQGLMFETRLTFHVLPTTGTETVQAAFGLASAHNTTLDSVATNAWFRVESAAQTALLWETDDGNADDDDNAAGITLVADTYHIYRIDCRDLVNGVKFYVDNALVGTSADFLTNLTDAEAKVQPYFNLSKAVSANNTGVGTIYIDYVRMWQNRS